MDEHREDAGIHLEAGLFHGEYGNQGVAMVSATIASAAVNMRQMWPRGSAAKALQRQPAASIQPPACCLA